MRIYNIYAKEWQKKAEIGMKRILHSLVSKIFQAHKIIQPDLSECNTILLLRQDKIGDMIITTGIIRMLKQHYPNLDIDVVASGSNAQVLNNFQYVNKIFIYNKKPVQTIKMILALRKIKYQIIVNTVLYSSLTGAIMTALAGRKAAYRARMTPGDDKNSFYNINVVCNAWKSPTRTMLEETAAIFQSLGVNYNKEEIRPFVQLATEKNLNKYDYWYEEKCANKICIGLNIVAAVKDREAPNGWTVDFVKELCRRIPSCMIFLFSPPSSQKHTDIIASLTSLNVHTIPEHENLMDAAGYLSKMNLMISVDTSTVHLAAALKIPVAILYAVRGNSVLWEPYMSENIKFVAQNGNWEMLGKVKVAEDIKAFLNV
jgi:ADP-heptose:LPS heptosyltransferase